jgi:hypothetical protein
VAARPRPSVEDENAIQRIIWSRDLSDNPEKFVRFVFPWGQKGTPLERFSGPRTWQLQVLRRVAEHLRTGSAHEALGMAFEMLRLSRVSGRGIGKSALVCWLILWFLSTRLGATVLVSANTEHQLRTVTWGELTKWVALSLNSHWWDISATALNPQGWIAELVEVQLQKGTRQWGAQGKLWSEENPDGYAGPHNMAGMMLIFDEASGIPDSIFSVAAGYFTEPILDRYWFTFSNGRRPSGYFYDCHNGTKAEFWDIGSIDARSVEGTDTAYYEQIIKEYGEDSNEARIEVYGGFPVENDEQLFPPHLIDAAMARPAWNDPTAPLIMGVDPARGGDKTVMRLRRGRDLVAKRQHNETDTMAIVALVVEAIQEFSPDAVVIDEGGLGYGIVDRLREMGYAVQGFNFGWKSTKPKTFANRRAQVYAAAREWIKTASIPPDPKLKRDLLAIKRDNPTTRGQMQLVSKDKMAFSPDDADALAMTFAFPVAAKSPSVDRMPLPTHTDYPSSPSWMGH